MKIVIVPIRKMLMIRDDIASGRESAMGLLSTVDSESAEAKRLLNGIVRLQVALMEIDELLAQVRETT